MLVKQLISCLTLATSLALPGVAVAQEYPTRTVSIVVPFSPGGATDTLARILADKLAGRLGKPVIVDNRPGGNTLIATQYVQKAAADGHTLYLVAGQFGVLPAITPAVAKYDPVKDFSPIAQATGMLMVMVANPTLPYKTVPELLAYAKAHPGKINVATTGVGSTDHLGGELLAYRSGVKFNFVPYKGAAPALQDVISGVADIRLDAMPSSRQFIESGRLKALAVFDPVRSPVYPAIPAIGESVKGVEFGGYFGLVGPRGMPASVVNRLSQEIAAIMALPEVMERVVAMGLDVKVRGANEFSAEIQTDAAQWKKLLSDTGLKIEE